MKKIIILFLVLLFCKGLKSQSGFPFRDPSISDGAIFDTVFDQNGQKYALQDLAIDPIPGYPNSNLRPAPTVSCSAGYFNVYFAPNSAFTGTNGTAMQNVMCTLFTNLSNFISSPLSVGGNTVRVNVYCTDLPTGSPAAGTAGSFYAFPWAPSNTNPGIIDNVTQKTIITGANAYSGIPGSVFAYANNFYHATVNVNPGLSWHTNLATSNISATDFDLYTVMLHEVTHALGFASLIGSNGGSLLGTLNNYYDRYDKFLTNSSNVPLLSSSTASCLNSNLSFTGSISQIAPLSCTTANSPPDVTTCSSAARYISPNVNVAVYTPNCFETGSSLSHFEDICSTPSWFTSTCSVTPPGTYNNLYFVMSNASAGQGNCYVRRYLKEEERYVLCNIGYNVNTVYNSTAAGAQHTYTGSSCSGQTIYGINDGFSSGAYTFTTTTSSINIPLSTITANDFPTTASVSCLEVVYNSFATAAIVGSNVQVNTIGGYTGLVILKYYPKVGTQYGNDTYIFVYFIPPGCNPPSACNMVQNNGFENLNTSVNNCGEFFAPLTATVGPKVSCWDRHELTPDLFSRGCTAAPLGFSWFNTGNNTYSTIPVVNSFNGSPNNNIVGLGWVAFSGGTYAYGSEAIKSPLSSPLTIGQAYSLSFWVYNYAGPFAGGSMNPTQAPIVLSFASDVNVTTAPTGNYPVGLNVLGSYTINAGTWTQITNTFVFSGTSAHSGLYAGIDGANSYALGNLFGSSAGYLFIDELSILPIGANTPTFVISPNCGAGTYTNLAQYASPVPGVFTGTGVTQSGGNYNFNSPPALTPGAYPVAFTYTAPNNCVNTLWQNVYVGGITTFTNPFGCTVNGYQLNATGFPSGTTYTWYPGAQTTQSINVFISTPTVYTLVAQTGTTCLQTFTTLINLTLPTPSISPTPSMCIGQFNSANPLNGYLTPTSPVGGIFSGLGVTQQSCPAPYYNCYYINLTSPPTYTPGVYNYTYTVPANPSQGYYCPVTTTFNVVFSPTYALNVSANPSVSCITSGQSVLLTASSSPSTGVSYTWQPTGQTTASISVTPAITTVYSVTSSNGGCIYNSPYTINVTNPITFTNIPAFFCTNTNYQYLENYLAAGTPTGGIFYGLPGITYNGPGYTSFNIPLNAVGIFTVVYTYTNSTTGCTGTANFTANAVQGVSVSTAQQILYCSNIGPATITATATPSAGVTFTWQPGNLVGATQTVAPASTAFYTVTASNGQCQATDRLEVDISNACCTASNYFVSNAINTGTYTGQWAINQNTTIYGNVAFGGEFRIAPGVSITVVPGSTLTSLTQADGFGVHMYSCSNMWQGIVAQNGGKVIFQYGDLIEDAVEAIRSESATATTGVDIKLWDVVFNRNKTAVVISGYNQTVNSPPFEIARCVFTCRDMNVAVGGTVWPLADNASGLRAATGSTATLASPYLLQSLNPVNLKAPNNATPSWYGVVVENSGVSASVTGTNPTYYSITVGDQTHPSYFNLFDNLMHGIYSRNSNLKSYNNTFQNTKRLFVLVGVKPKLLGGIGIYGVNDNSFGNTTNYLTTVTTNSPSVNINTFFDCHYGITAINVFQLNVKYADFRSTQSAIATASPLSPGQYGIAVTSNKMKNYVLENNYVRNINTGMQLDATTGTLVIQGAGINTYGSYFGSVSVKSNTLSAAYTPTSSIGTSFMNEGIYAGSFLNMMIAGNKIFEPGASLKVQDNLLSKVRRGIKVTNFSNNSFTTTVANNAVTLQQDLTVTQQYGINIQYCNNAVANTNTITGFSVNSFSMVSGMYFTYNSMCTERCNVVDKSYNAYQFAGMNLGSVWRSNTIKAPCPRGMRLSASGAIGQQGNSTTPGDNVWTGNWTGTNYNTWTDTFSYAINSKLYLRTSTTYTPLNNNGIFVNNSYSLATGARIAVTVTAAVVPCSPIGGSNNNPPQTNRSMAEDVVQDSLYYYDRIWETNEINKSMLYRILDSDPTFNDSSSVLYDFYTDMRGHNLGQLYIAEKYIADGDFENAGTVLDAISPGSHIETNYLNFCRLALNYLRDGELSAADSATLYTLAYKCPFLDGAVVYQARDLFNQAYQCNIIYTDENCIGIQHSYRTNPYNGGKQPDEYVKTDVMAIKAKAKPLSLKIYPNPASDEISVSSIYANETIQMLIIDVNGRQLMSRNIALKNYSSRVKLNLNNGIYFVTLTDSYGRKTHHKLIISK